MKTNTLGALTDRQIGKSETPISKQFNQIEDYVRFAETLPKELSQIKIYLGYDTSNVPELSPESMQSLFTDIRSHVDLWKELSAQAKNQMRELSITAAEVVKDGSSLLRGLDALDPVAKIINTVGKTSLDPSDFEGSSEPLTRSTIDKLNRLKPYIDSLHTTSLDSLGDTNATIKLIADFRTMSSVLEAHVADKVDKLKEGNSEVIGKEKTIEPIIDAFKDTCARLAAKFGEGSEGAIAIQNQIDMTLVELTSRKDNLQQQQRLTYAVGRLFVHLQGLGYAMIDAQSALTHLWLSSSSTCSRLNNIASDLGSIDTEEYLLRFYIDYKIVINDWVSIKEDASNFYKTI